MPAPPPPYRLTRRRGSRDGPALCEHCGYILRGRPGTANCPECGRPIGESAGRYRRPGTFKAAPFIASLVRTVLAVVFRPGQFFGGLVTRPLGSRADWFARCHRFVAAALLSVAACALAMIDRPLPTAMAA